MNPRRSPIPHRIRVLSSGGRQMDVPLDVAIRVLAVLDRVEVRPSVRAQHPLDAALIELLLRGLEAGDLTTEWWRDE